MRNVVTPILGLLLFAAAGWVGWRYVLPRLQRRGPGATPPPAEAQVEGLPAEFVARVERADDREAADLLRLARDRYLLPLQRAEFAALKQRRRERALANLGKSVEAMLDESRCADAVREVEAFESGWGPSGLLDAVRAEQARLVAERLAEVDALVEEGRYVAAREACRPPEGLFEETANETIRAHLERTEKRIRIRSYEPVRHLPVTESGPPPAAVRAEPSPPPALPGAPHPDVKRLGEARALLARMAKLFKIGQYGPLVPDAENLIGYFGDLKYVTRRIDAVRALLSYARYKGQGPKGLFHAASVQQRGKSTRLIYRFEKPEELWDWEELKPIPHASDGRFEQARGGVRGTGVAGLALRAFFDNEVRLSCISTPHKPESHGLAFLEAGNEQRQVILLATNHWFTEGENYVKKRPGHSILLIGKGVNNDVPVDSPEVGFVFKGPSRATPIPPPGADLDLMLALSGDQVKAEVRYRGDTAKLGVQARGDDGRGFQRHRPALFVVEAGVIFREVQIEGRLHPDFVRERERELLDLAGTAFE